jgi:hypothetical protein
MTILLNPACDVNPDIELDLSGSFVPSDEDAAWVAEAFNADADDFDIEDDCDEWAALEAAAMDAMELGLLPPDLGNYLASTSLVGLDETTADAIMHRGSDPRWCGCYACVEVRTRNYAC